MPYIPNTDNDRAQMLKTIGASDFEELVSNIPSEFRIDKLDLPVALSEWEMQKELKRLATQNKSTDSHVSFLGGGAYDHFIPSAVDSIVSRPEFYTAYTPYQAEMSQGTLQAMYEFQTCVSMISGMEVSNASMYDGASALAEGIWMACNLKKGTTVLVASTIHPNYKQVIETYLSGTPYQIVYVDEIDGILNINDLGSKLSDDVCCVAVQHPNFYGNLEEVEEINNRIKCFADVKYVVSYNPIATALLEPPGSYGADIATAEGQALGLSLSLGGPYVGLFSTKNQYIRKMPGRMSGQTIDSDKQVGFTLTLQTREQHIKREKATSNICTNQGLMTVASLVYMSLMGREGIKNVATMSYNNAHYLAEEICKLEGFKMRFPQEFFNEFVIDVDRNIPEVLTALDSNGIMGGINLERFGSNGILIAVTEKRSKEEMDLYVDTLTKIQ